MSGHLENETRGYVPELYDELYRAAPAVCRAYTFLDLDPEFAAPHCRSMPNPVVLIAANREVPWTTIQSVIYTTAAYSLNTMQFVVAGRMRALDVEVRSVSPEGPPSTEETRACALPVVSRGKSGLDVRYRAARLQQETVQGLGVNEVRDWVEFLDQPERGEQLGDRAFGWSGGLVVVTPGATACRSKRGSRRWL